MAISRKLTAAAALLLCFLLPSHAYDEVPLRVRLDRIHGADFTRFLHAAVPELTDRSPRRPTDLNTLATLHQYVQNQTYFLHRGDDAASKATRRDLDRVLRAKIRETPLPTLRRLALGDGEVDYGNGSLMLALYQKLIEQEVKKILAEPKRELVFPTPSTPMPEEWRSAAADTVSSAELDRACGPFARLLTELSNDPAKGFNADGDAHYVLKRKLLLSDDPQHGAEFLRYTWDSWCGTGAAESRQMNRTVALIALLRERRIEEAVGISFYVPDSPQWLREPGRPFDQWRFDLLKYAGIDWEDTMLSAERYAFLAAAGSERAAKHLLATTTAPDPVYGEWFDLERLATFLVPTLYGESNNDPRSRISHETQLEILQLIDGVARKPRSYRELNHVLNIIEELERPETKDTLRHLLSHESTTYAGRAANRLRSLGETVEEIPPAAPVRFRLFHNGSPLRSAKLGYTFTSKGIQVNGGELIVDSEGYTSIARDYFLDPATRSSSLVFFDSPLAGTMGTLNPQDQAWLEKKITHPKDFGAITEVHFSTCQLPISIRYPAPPPPVEDAPMQMTLTKVGAEAGSVSRFELHFRKQGTVAPKELVYSAIPPGTYQVIVKAPGTRSLETAPFEVKPGMEPVKITLEKATDVYATVLTPANARGHNFVLLLKDGVEVRDGSLQRDEGVRPIFGELDDGEYELRVLSTTEYMKWKKTNSSGDPVRPVEEDISALVDCQGVAKRFTVSSDTPQLLDLGQLVNLPVKEMKDKAGQMVRYGASAPGSAPQE